MRSLTIAWPATDSPGKRPMLMVAFASSDRVSVNQHFGASAGFSIYAVDSIQAALAGAVEFDAAARDGNEHKLEARIVALDGCDAVYCQAIGASAVRRLLDRGIQPLRLDQAERIDTLLQQLRAGICGKDIPWIERALKRKQRSDDRFSDMAAEGWQG